MKLIKKGNYAELYNDETNNRYIVKVDYENRKYVFGREISAQKLFKEKEKKYKL